MPLLARPFAFGVTTNRRRLTDSSTLDAPPGIKISVPSGSTVMKSFEGSKVSLIPSGIKKSDALIVTITSAAETATTVIAAEETITAAAPSIKTTNTT